MSEATRQLLREALADCIITLRTRKGIAQEKLAFQAGVDRAYMGGLERALHSPTIETIHKLIQALEVSYVEFAQQYERSLKKKAKRHVNQNHEGGSPSLAR